MPTPKSLEMSYFYVKNLRKHQILEKYLAKKNFGQLIVAN